MNATSRCLAMAMLLGLAGCGRPFEVNTPTGFVELEEEPGAGYDYRATSAEGVVVAVRAVDVEGQGSLAFWEKAVTLKVRDVGGYALLEARDVKSADGTQGRRLHFAHDEHGTPYAYVVTLFVAQDRLFLLEAGGEQRLFAQYAPKLDWQVQTFEAQCGFFLAPVFASRTCNRW